MTIQTRTKQKISEEHDMITARHLVRKLTIELGFSLVDQTRIITAVSELTRNALIYAGGGVLIIEILQGSNKGLKVTIKDRGPGIEDIEQAMTDGYSTGRGLGHGLGGSKKLVDEFEISSQIGKGTTVVVVKWIS